jgi:hypothetical protein
MSKQVNARLIVDHVTIPCSEAIFSMRVLSGPNGKPDHSKQSILLDVFINTEDPTVTEPVLDTVKDLYNKLSAGSASSPELNIQVDFDDDFNKEATLATFKFKGRLHLHTLLKILNSARAGVPDINVFHLQIAPTLNNPIGKPVTMSN